jgi:hypothetical protein
VKLVGERAGGLVKMRVAPESGDGPTVKVSVLSEFFEGRGEEVPWQLRRHTDEFDYGYALTVHKAQGSQWDNVVLFDESFAFREHRQRWLYTAVTRALANCARHGVNRDSMIVWKTDTRGMTAEMLSAKLGGQKVRFFHIDGDHSDECLSKDLELATAVLHEKGLLCLDDILHPGYPTLVLTVMRYLERHPEMVVHAIIDREDIVAAPKFLIGRRETVDLYVTELMRAYPQFIFVMGADFVSYGALVLTPKPRLAEVD